MYLVLSGLLALRQLSIQDTGGGVILGSGGYIGGLEYILAGIFVVISLLIIIIQSIKLAGKAETEKEEIEQK